MPIETLLKLPVDISHMRSSHMRVRAFDGARREVVGYIEIPLSFGPCTFHVEFPVMSISPSYSPVPVPKLSTANAMVIKSRKQ